MHSSKRNLKLGKWIKNKTNKKDKKINKTIDFNYLIYFFSFTLFQYL
jgi:hypothetical protein